MKPSPRLVSRAPTSSIASEDDETEKGQEHLVLRIEGEGYFDWKGLVAQEQVKAGDKERLRVSDGQYPRIYDLEKLGDAEFKKAQAQAGTAPSARTGSRDEFIARLSCARTASLALSVVQMPVKEKVKELFHLAEELEKWVRSTSDSGEEKDTSPKQTLRMRHWARVPVKPPPYGH